MWRRELKGFEVLNRRVISFGLGFFVIGVYRMNFGMVRMEVRRLVGSLCSCLGRIE